MGLFSSSKSSSTNNNYDQRQITDYGNAIFDLDSSQRTDNSVSGFGNNNTGTIHVTDGGAIDGMRTLATAVVDGGANMVNRIGAMAGDVVRQNTNLAESAIYGATDMLDTTSYALDNANERTLAAAMDINATTSRQLDSGYNLARDLNNSSLSFADNANYGAMSFASDANELAMDAVANSTDDAVDGLNTGFKSMMQFADSFSRSDGNDFAETQMKTIGLIVAGVAVIGVAAIILRKR